MRATEEADLAEGASVESIRGWAIQLAVIRRWNSRTAPGVHAASGGSESQADFALIERSRMAAPPRRPRRPGASRCPSVPGRACAGRYRAFAEIKMLIAIADHPAQVRGRPDLEGPEPHARMLRHQLDRVIQVARLEHEDSAQRLLGLRIGTIRHRGLAVLPAQGLGGVGALQRLAPSEVSALAQHVVVGEALVHHRVALALRHGLELVRSDVAKTYELHVNSSRGGDDAGFARRPSHTL